MKNLRQQREEALRQSEAGAELRIIELKKLVNELCQRHGEGARYPLEFEQDTKPAKAESPTVLPGDCLAPLDPVQSGQAMERASAELRRAASRTRMKRR